MNNINIYRYDCKANLNARQKTEFGDQRGETHSCSN